MSKGKIASKDPSIEALEAGKKYFWCSCGLSQSQPFCDGSHKSTDFEPVCFQAKQKGKRAICCCKQTKTPPYCDGTHNEL